MQIKYLGVCARAHSRYHCSVCSDKVYAYGLLLMHARTHFRIHFQTLTDMHIAQTAAVAAAKQKMQTYDERKRHTHSLTPYRRIPYSVRNSFIISQSPEIPFFVVVPLSVSFSDCWFFFFLWFYTLIRSRGRFFCFICFKLYFPFVVCLKLSC